MGNSDLFLGLNSYNQVRFYNIKAICCTSDSNFWWDTHAVRR